MKRMTLVLVLLIAALSEGRTQQIDSIFFNLYTDSLKKGTHNYINVDAKMSNGRWLPMTSKEIVFWSSVFRFSGNELIVPADCADQKVEIRASLRANPSVSIQRFVWIKQMPDPELPPYSPEPSNRSGRGRKRS